MTYGYLGAACNNRVFIDKFGGKTWLMDGMRHREDGPAVEFINGDKFWYISGYLHRLDGPAVVRSNGILGWYLHGAEIREEPFDFRIELIRIHNLTKEERKDI